MAQAARASRRERLHELARSYAGRIGVVGGWACLYRPDRGCKFFATAASVVYR